MKKKLFAIVIGLIFAFDILFLVSHIKEAETRNNEIDIKFNELYDRVNVLQTRVDRLECMIDKDLLESFDD